MTTRDALDAALQRENVDDAMSELIGTAGVAQDADTLHQAIHRSIAGSWPTSDHPDERSRNRPGS